MEKKPMDQGSKCTREVTPGVLRARSACEGYRREIEETVGQGLSSQRIYKELVSGRGFGASYQSVKRFVAGLKAKEPTRVWRMESLQGEELQVDFGLGAIIEGEDGRRRRSWVLRAVLSYSRKGYSEGVFRQDTETFLRCLENAFGHFGGVPLVLNLDNLKAGVVKADWYDPKSRSCDVMVRGRPANFGGRVGCASTTIARKLAGHPTAGFRIIPSCETVP